jgi:hypothetical protein
MTLLGKLVFSVIVLGSIFIGVYYLSHKEDQVIPSTTVTTQEQDIVSTRCVPAIGSMPILAAVFSE